MTCSTSGAGSPSASGRLTARRVSRVKVVDTMKKISNRKTTSISGVRLIESSS